MTFTDEALVLSTTLFREQDKRIALLTRKHGRVDCVAVSACNTKSKLAGHLQPFRKISVMIAPGKQFMRVAQAVTQTAFAPCSLERARLMAVAGRFVIRTTEQGMLDDEIFNSLQKIWAIAQSVIKIDLYDEFNAAFESLISTTGYAPEFSACVVCQKKERAVSFRFFSLPLGGLVCANCPPEFPVLQYSLGSVQKYNFLRSHATWRDLL